MAENDLKQKNFNIEIVKQLLLRDINDISVNNDMDKSTFCEVEESFPPRIQVTRTYSRPTPQKRILKSIENNCPVVESSDIILKKRKKTKDEVKLKFKYDNSNYLRNSDVNTENIEKIEKQFRKVKEFQLTVE
ncbi:hypothetical protein PGB90_006756 [Kerria lacca]